VKTDTSLTHLFQDTHELEEFFHAFISQLVKRRLRDGADVTRYVDTFGLKTPAALKGVPMTWLSEGSAHDADGEDAEQTLVLARPGEADAIGLTIGCIRFGRFKACLECGWLYCRVVIKGTF
jgi:hypothetical protein